MSYYNTQDQNRKKYLYIQKEKFRLSTRKWDYVTHIINEYKVRATSELSTSAKILKGIYEKNKLIALKQRPFQKTTNIVSFISRPETLLLAYKRIKSNKGAMTKAANVDENTLKNYNPRQRSFYYRKHIFPDGFSLRDVELAGYLIRKGEYPWGSSRRIWLDKPGDKTKKRPITIPPFMDRIVQEAIKMVLYAIWEPDFETLNRSFGFRPNKSCHDAISAIKTNITTGMFNAIEGDIESAYDKVNKKILLQQLRRKIQDNAFIELMSHRLNYDYVDEEKNVRTRPALGIPQGGIDSPYLFNIYLHDLDLFIHTEVNKYINDLNKKPDIPPNKTGKDYNYRISMGYRILRRQKALKPLKETIKKMDPRKADTYRKSLYEKIKQIRLMNHKMRQIPSIDPNKRRIRFFYVRYADDWILLGNFDQQIAKKIKGKISSFLTNELHATLSKKKTIVTDISESPAHFLGFEIKRAPQGRLIYVKGKLRRASGLILQTKPDRQRLINRLHMKGFCDEDGFPIHIPWLARYEAHTIIQRYNASMFGLMQYYTEWVDDKNSIRRWIYIMRYSCFKTLANKYRITISKVFRKFGINLYSSSKKTIQAEAKITVGNVTYVKEWKLLTFEEMKIKCLLQGRLQKISSAFLEKEKGISIGDYPINSTVPAVTNENFLNTITWVSYRTQSTFDLPCSICGSKDSIEMHHIRHIRKSPYSKLENKSFLQVMSLRNRKSIPICRNCHINVIHKGKYSGEALSNLMTRKTLTDNRIVHIESFIKTGKEYYAKSLEEKGWAIEMEI
jgi:retron-type reverse transcriptase